MVAAGLLERVEAFWIEVGRGRIEGTHARGVRPARDVRSDGPSDRQQPPKRREIGHGGELGVAAAFEDFVDVFDPPSVNSVKRRRLRLPVLPPLLLLRHPYQRLSLRWFACWGCRAG
jgi:hypothetical protein